MEDVNPDASFPGWEPDAAIAGRPLGASHARVLRRHEPAEPELYQQQPSRGRDPEPLSMGHRWAYVAIGLAWAERQGEQEGHGGKRVAGDQVRGDGPRCQFRKAMEANELPVIRCAVTVHGANLSQTVSAPRAIWTAINAAAAVSRAVT